MHWRLVLNIALVVSLQACHLDKRSDAIQHGANTPHRIVTQYLVALEHRDRELMRQLLPKKQFDPRSVNAKIAKFGGHKLQAVQTIYAKPKATLWQAKITGFYLDRQGKRQAVEDSIVIASQVSGFWKINRGRWYLLLDQDAVLP